MSICSKCKINEAFVVDKWLCKKCLMGALFGE